MVKAHVGILGIDRIEKEPFLCVMERCLRQAGVGVTWISWQRRLAEMAAPNGGRCAQSADFELERLWLDVFRLYFEGARIDGRPLRIPASYKEMVDGDFVGQLRRGVIRGLNGESVLAGAWLEVAGFSILHHQIVRPLVESRGVVIQRSMGFKNVLKSLVIAEALDPELVVVVRAGIDFVSELFGIALRPDIGIYLVADPCRIVVRGTPGEVGVFESLRLAGRDPLEGFRELQCRCASEFERFAEKHGWIRVDVMDDLAQDFEHLGERIADVILKSLG